jgi:hypothetical protein
MPNNFAHLGGLNAYEILGIQPTATTEEIEAAYRAAIKRQHSDTGGVTRLAQLVKTRGMPWSKIERRTTPGSETRPGRE